jgi:HAD superfamily hydrolase (TIGR01548 family)
MRRVSPQLVIFDVDGVLVDVRGSFHRSILDTVKFFTGRRVTYGEISAWKNRGGYNDDWRLSTDWIASLGKKVGYATVKRQFMQFYWGDKTYAGNVTRERWLVPRRRLERWSRRAPLALFTGRTRTELDHTLDRLKTRQYFTQIVTMDDVRRLKPDPEGLLRLLGKLDPRDAVYLGDNVDDALSSQRAGVPFFGVLPGGGTLKARRTRAALLRKFGALRVFDSASELEKYWQ